MSFLCETVSNRENHCNYRDPRCHTLISTRKYNLDIPRSLRAPLLRLKTPFDASVLSFPNSGQTDDSVYADKVEFLKMLNQHVRLAKPDKWLSLLSGLSTDELFAHEWVETKVDYSLVLLRGQLDAAHKAGLRRSVLIPAESQLGQNDPILNSTGGPLSETSIPQLLRYIFWKCNVLQTSGNCPSIIEKYKAIRDRFGSRPKRKGVPWKSLKGHDWFIADFTSLQSLEYYNISHTCGCWEAVNVGHSSAKGALSTGPMSTVV